MDDGSGLLSACPRLHDEYLPILMLYASSIRAEVRNFDFQDLIYTFNRLPSGRLNSLSSTTQPRSQQLHIDLLVTNSSNANVHLLFRWLNRATRNTKKGAELDISYSLKCTFADECADYRSRYSKKALLVNWTTSLKMYLKCMKNGRANDEAKKLKALFDAVV